MPTVHDLTQPIQTDISHDVDLIMQSPEYHDPNSIQGQQLRDIVRTSFELKFGKANLTRRPAPIVIDSGEMHPSSNSTKWG